MPVDQPRHQHAALQINDLSRRADQRLNPVVIADIDQYSGTLGGRLLDRVAGIGGKHIAMLEDDIRRLGRLRCHREHGKKDCERGGFHTLDTL